jgi:YfiH family protein
MWIQSAAISCIHGFSTRNEGVSTGPFSSLNLGGKDDAPENIQTNRTRALSSLGLNVSQVCTLGQIHGADVIRAEPGKKLTGDALVSNTRGTALAISVADCYPILFHDPETNVIGAAHAGWRGTCAKIAENVIREMILLGANAQRIKIAIGPGISQERFEVGPEVIQQFIDAGFPDTIVRKNKIDLAAANSWLVQKNCVPSENIHVLGRCTFEDDFFSYRQDNGLTGRMWGLIALP